MQKAPLTHYGSRVRTHGSTLIFHSNPIRSYLLTREDGGTFSSRGSGVVFPLSPLGLAPTVRSLQLVIRLLFPSLPFI